MTFSLSWMPSVLEAAGLKVAEVEGWKLRGRADMGQVQGVMIHHTVGPKQGNMPSLRTLVEGRHDLPGPLCNLGLGRDGTCYVVAAGRANHAGAGQWQGVTTGNSSFIGIECENTGLLNDLPWPDVQMDALRRASAALLSHNNRSAQWCVGHKEYALPAGRKPDPLFDMALFRRDVAAIQEGRGIVRPLIPAVEAAVASGMQAPRSTLRRGSEGPLVMEVQVALSLDTPSGYFDAKTEAAVRQWQSQHGLVPDGIVGPKTWAQLDRRS